MIMRFKTIADVEEYLSGDKVTCLLCGRQFKMLCAHILPAHGIDAYEYKRKFNIPRKYALSVKSVTEKKKNSPYMGSPRNIAILARVHADSIEERKKYETLRCDLSKSLNNSINLEGGWTKINLRRSIQKARQEIARK